jgi:hypothetical protein
MDPSMFRDLPKIFAGVVVLAVVVGVIAGAAFF